MYNTETELLAALATNGLNAVTPKVIQDFIDSRYLYGALGLSAPTQVLITTGTSSSARMIQFDRELWTPRGFTHDLPNGYIGVQSFALVLAQLTFTPLPGASVNRYSAAIYAEASSTVSRFPIAFQERDAATGEEPLSFTMMAAHVRNTSPIGVGVYCNNSNTNVTLESGILMAFRRVEGT